MPVFRFYAELNDFLAPVLRGRSFERAAAPHESLKHAIESLGVPHTEVALALADGRPVTLGRRAEGVGRVSLYPAFRRLGPLPTGPDDSAVAPLRETTAVDAGARNAGEPRFVADVHLGRLARMLRFAGYDTLWRSTWDDADLAAKARAEGRIVLTRDRDLLMHRDVERGCHLRDSAPAAQFAELVRRLGLQLRRRPRAGRCLDCNAVLEPVEKAQVEAALPDGTRRHFEHFWRCPCCGGVFWCGSHWKRMRATLDAVAAASGTSDEPGRPAED